MDYSKLEAYVTRTQDSNKKAVKNKSYSEIWLKVAKDDLIVSKILYDSGHFASSIYHLQQSYEKLVKCFYLFSGRSTNEEIKGHDYGLVKLKKEISGDHFKMALDLIKQDSNKDSNIRKLNFNDNSFDVLEKHEDEIRTATGDELKLILNELSKIDNNLLSKKVLGRIEAKINSKKAKKTIKQLILHVTHFRVTRSQVNEICSLCDIKSYIYSSILSMRLFILGIITYPHWNTPRYPYNKNTDFGFLNYNKDLGIVSLFDNFYSDGMKIIKELASGISDLE